jgi:hypothetical protein
MQLLKLKDSTPMSYADFESEYFNHKDKYAVEYKEELESICGYANQYLIMRTFNTASTSKYPGKAPKRSRVIEFCYKNPSILKRLAESNESYIQKCNIDDIQKLLMSIPSVPEKIKIKIIVEDKYVDVKEEITSHLVENQAYFGLKAYDKIRYERWKKVNPNLIKFFDQCLPSSENDYECMLNDYKLLDSWFRRGYNYEYRSQNKENLLKFFYSIVEDCKIIFGV